eukprot:TRINITY_DN38695_c0_g1_i1.p1 TRINITY_DN38695_c0_g1~~TRINITY_DN38695_c0_g1_i1.p1  ORF type:complete len:458 (+),score=166.85 TRINITY_DN38695_c0_g1_i1:31-1374(+)
MKVSFRTLRTLCTAAPGRQTAALLQQLKPDAVNGDSLPAIFEALQAGPDAHGADLAQLRRAAAAALSAYDTDDTRSEAIAQGIGRLSGAEVVVQALEGHVEDTEICDHTLRAMINLTWLTVSDPSKSSNQALLGAEGAVPLAAQVLHLHGRSNTKLCSRGLHALLMLTMYNESNTTEAINNDIANLVIAMLSHHPGNADVQDTGLALLLRLLHAPLHDNPKLDYLYEENPLTAMHVFIRAASQFPSLLPVQEKVWQGLALLAHNHATLPDLARELSRSDLVVPLAEQLMQVAASSSDEEPLRDQMLRNSASVLATLLEGDTADQDVGMLARGDFTKVCITALNKGVPDDVDYALSSLLLSLSSREDPVLLSESAMLTLLVRLRMERAGEATKLTLRTVWNVLNYQEGRRFFVAHNGLRIVKDVRLQDEETQKLVEDVVTKSQVGIEA